MSIGMGFSIFARERSNSIYNVSNFAKGVRPYVKDRGMFGEKSYLQDDITPRANDMKAKYNTMQNKQKAAAEKQFYEQVASFNSSSIRDIREQSVTDKTEAAFANREKAVDLSAAEVSYRRPRSSAEARTSYNQRVDGFNRARRELKKAGSNAASAFGTDVTFNLTGYERLDASIDTFYQQFDDEMKERRDSYAQDYGFDSYDDITVKGYYNMSDQAGSYWSGPYGNTESMMSADINGQSTQVNKELFNNFMQENSWGDYADKAEDEFGTTYNVDAVRSDTMEWNPLTGRNEWTYSGGDYDSMEHGDAFQEYLAGKQGAGQADINALIMGDILGDNAYDVAYLDSVKVNNDSSTITAAGTSGYMQEAISNIRRGLGSLWETSRKGINDAADFEDKSRAELAAEMEDQARFRQKVVADKTQESISGQISDLNSAQRTAKQKLAEQEAALTAGLSSSARKVRDVTFDAGRPQ